MSKVTIENGVQDRVTRSLDQVIQHDTYVNFVRPDGTENIEIVASGDVFDVEELIDFLENVLTELYDL